MNFKFKEGLHLLSLEDYSKLINKDSKVFKQLRKLFKSDTNKRPVKPYKTEGGKSNPDITDRGSGR